VNHGWSSNWRIGGFQKRQGTGKKTKRPGWPGKKGGGFFGQLCKKHDLSRMTGVYDAFQTGKKEKKVKHIKKN